MRRIAIFGGTFDPVHYGHIKTSMLVQATFQFDSYLFLPCKIPIMKPNSLANNQQRIDMLQLAIKNHTEFKLDLREIKRESPSYMCDTLQSFRTQYPTDSITLILGYDAFISLPQWHQWEKLITLAHLLVIHRPEWSKQDLPKALQNLLHKHPNNTQLTSNPAGSICFFDAGQYDFSSTQIRAELKQDINITSKLPKDVYSYIKEKGLYQ